jgi:DNA repair exonuclease SbcCD ATPase subunit
MGKVLGEVSEAVYDNTVSVAQLKSVTGSDLVRELQNYMAGYQGTGDSSMDLGRASQMLKMSRKGFQVQSDRRQKELEKEKTKLAANMEYLKTEMDDLQEKRVQVEEAKENLRTGKNVQEGESILQDRIIQVQKRQLLTRVLLVAALVIGVGLGAAVFRGVIPRMLSIGGGILLALAGIYYDRKLGRELHKRQRTKARWLAKQEKLSWDGGNLDASYAEKELAYKNLQAEYAECEEQQYLPGTEDLEIRALNMALETIEKLSGNINNHLGEGLRRRTSEILSEITGGKYQEVLMDKDFHMSVNSQDRVVPLERLSRGTMEQIYFALRMAAGDMFCEQEPFPVILDDVFGMYDEDRLAAVLRWLHKEQRQTIISTCHKREMELLDREGIPYQKLILE